MKKIYIALAVLATAMLASCVQEKSFNDEKIGENAVVFSVGRTAATKAAQNVVVSRQSIEMPNDAIEGTKLFLEETVTLLDNCAPATKGTPAYTENVGTLYGNKLGVYSTNLNFGNQTYVKMDDALVDGGWRYQYNYSTDPWPDESTAVDFYFRMPSDMSGINGDFTYAKTDGKQTISFSYTSPSTAAKQQDILFGARSASKANYKSSLPNGVPVLLNHALTGVKFAIAEDVKATIMIDSVSFSGIIDKGKCVVTPASENNYRDNITNYSSATAVVWSDTTRTAGKTYSAAYTDTVTYAKNTAGSFESAGNYPKSFANGGNANNLDDADGNAAQTFWLIPQVLQNDATLTINYTVKSSATATSGTSYSYTISFGKTLKAKSVEWKAGELHTYTIRVDDVNVKIEDVVSLESNTASITDEGGRPYSYTSYKGSKKSNVKIQNTGNTDAYIRVALIGQWLDEDGNPVFGYTDFTKQKVVLVDSWYQDQFVRSASEGRTHGHFSQLVGYTYVGNDDPDYKDYSGSKWVKGDDDFYYYTDIVEVGDYTEEPIFDTYTVGVAPAVAVAGAVKQIYFQLEISTQAISAKQLDGSNWPTYTAAWDNAFSQN